MSRVYVAGPPWKVNVIGRYPVNGSRGAMLGVVGIAVARVAKAEASNSVYFMMIWSKNNLIFEVVLSWKLERMGLIGVYISGGESDGRVSFYTKFGIRY